MNFADDSYKFFNGNIYHKRIGNVEHFFKNKINAILINLKKEDEGIKDTIPGFFSIDRFNLFSWSPKDHGAQVEKSKKKDLYNFIENLIESTSNQKNKIKKIKLLTFPRILNLGFNPLSVYFCYNKDSLLIHYVFEVRNTFGDMHHYILDNVNKKGITQKTSKKLFVSPFYQKKGQYELYANYSDNKIQTSVKYFINDKLAFSASMNLKEINFNNENILFSLITLKSYPGKI